MRWQGTGRLPALDGLRAYAALVVVSVHLFAFGDVAWGVTSVWVFFVLSGFLVFKPFADREFRFGLRDVAAYLTRRAFRVLPLYWAALLVYRAVGVPPYLGEPSWLADNLTFARAAGHFWTVKQEVIFYLVLPVVAAACALLRTWRAALGLVLLLVPASYLVFDVAGVWVLHGGLGGMLLYVTPFFCGMALAIVADRIRAPWGLPLLAVGLGGLLALAWRPTETFLAWERLLGLPKDGNPFAHPYLVWPFASALVLGAYLRPSPIFTNPVAHGIGVVSFGVYLWHALVVNLLMTRAGLLAPWPLYLATVGVSLAAATLTYVAIERPGTRCGAWLAARIERRAIPAAVTDAPSDDPTFAVARG